VWGKLGQYTQHLKSLFQTGISFSKLARWWQLKYVLFSPLFGEDFPFDEHMFQMGWFNHQPVWVFMGCVGVCRWEVALESWIC